MRCITPGNTDQLPPHQPLAWRGPRAGPGAALSLHWERVPIPALLLPLGMVGRGWGERPNPEVFYVEMRHLKAYCTPPLFFFNN